MSQKKSSSLKSLMRHLYIQFSSFLVIASLKSIPKKFRKGIHYGGALSGNNGGGLVKVKRLKENFPEKKFRFNIIYSLSNCPYLNKRTLQLAKRKNIPIIHNQNGVYYPSWYKGDWQLHNRQMATAYHLADYVFWQSEFCKRTANKFLGQREGPGEILYNSVDISFFKPEKQKRPRKKFTFLINGKIDKHLGYRIIIPIKALGLLKASGVNCDLVIAGLINQDVIHAAKDLSKKLNYEKNIHHVGPYTQEQAPNIYQMANAAIMLKQNDPCPNTVIEAMACGLPIIYADNGGLPELVGDNCGYSIQWKESFSDLKPPSVSKIAEALEKAAKDDGTKSLFARKKAISAFSIENWFSRHEKIFQKLTEEIQ